MQRTKDIEMKMEERQTGREERYREGEEERRTERERERERERKNGGREIEIQTERDRDYTYTPSQPALRDVTSLLSNVDPNVCFHTD